MTGSEVRKLSDVEISIEVERLRTKLFELRQQTVSEKVQNTTRFPSLRRDIARLLTERNARRITAAAAG